VVDAASDFEKKKKAGRSSRGGKRGGKKREKKGKRGELSTSSAVNEELRAPAGKEVEVFKVVCGLIPREKEKEKRAGGESSSP